MKLTLGKIIAASILFAGGIFLTMAAGSIYSIEQMKGTADWVSHTEEVEAHINAIYSRIAGWESANRGYIITGQEDYLEYYQDAKAQVDAELEVLHALIKDNPTEVENWKQLKAVADNRIELLNQGQVDRGPDGYDAAVESVNSGEGKRAMDAVENITKKMLVQEDGLLQERRGENEQRVAQSIASAVATSSVGLVVLILTSIVIGRQFMARKKAERALADSRAELQGIVDNAPLGIFLKDRAGRYLLLNQPMKDLLGVEPASCVGKTSAELFPAARAEIVQREDTGILADGRPLESDMDLVCPDGVARTFRTLKFPLRDAEGKIYALGGISSDITERKRMEGELHQALDAAEAASRTKSQFLANMSHELRTPLNSIIGFSEILSDKIFGSLNEKQHKYLGNILTSGRHLLLLINDLLDLAKIEAGKMQLEPEQTLVAGVVEDGLTLVRGSAERKGVALEIQPVDLTLAARLDPAKTKQIIYNLVSNAVKFTPAGGRVKISAEKVTQPPRPPRGLGSRGRQPGELLPGDWVRLTVADSGMGIDAESLERIFAEFEQLDSSYARQQEGTGLGLSLTRGLADLHGGCVWAESPGRVNRGSTFYVLLPLAGPPRTKEKAKPATAPMQMASTTNRLEGKIPANGAAKPAGVNGRSLILIVEDDEHARRLMADYLTNGGYDVAHAASGEEAMRMATTLRPAAITLDILLPDANGMDVLARLKATRATSQIPVVIVSVTDERQLGLSLGAVDFFVKPIKADKLLAALARTCASTKREIKHVLVVDDEAAAREAIVAVLEPRGYKVRATGSGEEALLMVAAEQPDVAIVDLTMPGMSGFELVTRLRQNPATRELPICIYTAKDLSAAELRWLHEQATAVTPKPFREQLLNELQRACADAVGAALP